MLNCIFLLWITVAAANLLNILGSTFDSGSIIIKVPRNLTSAGYLILHRFIQISFSETTGISDTYIDVADGKEIRKLREEEITETEPDRVNILAAWRTPTPAPSISLLPNLAPSDKPTPSPTLLPLNPVISWRVPSPFPTSRSGNPAISFRVPTPSPTPPPGNSTISWRVPTPSPTPPPGSPVISWRVPTPSPTFIAELHYVAKNFLITIRPSDKSLIIHVVSNGRFSDQLAVHIISNSGTDYDDLNNRVTLTSIASLVKIDFKETRSTPIVSDSKGSSKSEQTDLLYLVCLVAIIPIVFLVFFVLRKRKEKNSEETTDPIPSPSSLSLSEQTRSYLYTGKTKQRISFQSRENPLNTENPFHFESDAHYDVLGLNIESATTADIKTAYDRLKAAYIIDSDSSVEADGMLLKIEEAYQTLLLKHKTMDEAGNLWKLKSMLFK